MATTKAKASKKTRKPSSGGAKAPAKEKAQDPHEESARPYSRPALRSDDALVLNLDASIYPKAVLTQAAKAFAGLARIRIHKQGHEQIVTFADADADVVDRLPDEFANYALSYLVTQR